MIDIILEITFKVLLFIMFIFLDLQIKEYAEKRYFKAELLPALASSV